MFPPLGVNFIELDNKLRIILSIILGSQDINFSSFPYQKTIEISLLSI